MADADGNRTYTNNGLCRITPRPAPLPRARNCGCSFRLVTGSGWLLQAGLKSSAPVRDLSRGIAQLEDEYSCDKQCCDVDCQHTPDPPHLG